MTVKNEKDGKPVQPEERTISAKPGEMPGWTVGLRRLYDSVVDEEIPDAFRDLISKLDSTD